MLRFKSIRGLALLLPAALLGGAYVAELGFNLFPCEMCWWQRYPHFAALVPAILSFCVGSPGFARTLVALAALAILTSGLIGGYHAGVEYNWWEGLTSCGSTMGNSGDIMKDIMNVPLNRCDAAPWTFAGISLAGFNFLLSCGGAIAILVWIWKKPTRTFA